MLSSKTKYGLHAALYLAEHYHRGPILISELAEEKGLPKKFLETILLELKKKGVLDSRKGKGGGYFLRRSPHSISLGEIIRVLEGPLALVPCVSQTAYRRCEDCHNEAACGIRIVMKDVRQAMADILDHTTLATVVERIHTVSPATEYMI